MKLYYIPSENKLERRSHPPQGTYYIAPEGTRDASELSLTVMTDELSGENYMVAVLDQDKVANYDSQLSQAADARAWANLRAKRDQILKDTDFTQLADSPMTAQEKSDYATYRQELRDLPANTSDPYNPDFPEAP